MLNIHISTSCKVKIVILCLVYITWIKWEMVNIKLSSTHSYIKSESFKTATFHVHPRNHSVDYDRYDIHLEHCKIRHLDANDESILKFVGVTRPKLVCGSRPALTTLKNNVLHMDPFILAKYYKDIILDKCVYRVILRNYDSTNPDDHLAYSLQSIIFKNWTFCYDDFILVECYSVDNATHTFYSNVHANGLIDPIRYFKNNPANQNRVIYTRDNYTQDTNHLRQNVTPDVDSISKENSVLRDKILKKSKTRGIHDLSILMLGIDSTSRLNFIRGLPKTHAYLQHQRPESFLHKGYIKVGDNTFPNILPLTTGHFSSEYGVNPGKEHYFDNYSFVWNHYKREGYTTMFIEDSSDMSTFNYLRKGFFHPPTDFYFRPYSIYTSILGDEHNCLHDKHEVRTLFEYAQDLLNSFAEWPYFCFTYTTRLTHDYLNDVKYLDRIILPFFEQLFETGKLENTMIFIYGDHGMRYGRFRKTFIGMMEERLPLLYILPPKWFLEQYPAIAHNMRTNVDRIVTPFDFYDTLIHLLHLIKVGKSKFAPKRNGTKLTYTPQSYHNAAFVRSFSLFKEIPANRSCETASIPLHFCPCNVVGSIFNMEGDVRVLASASRMIEKLNEKIAGYVNVCLPIVLDAIKAVRVFKANWRDDEHFDERDIQELLIEKTAVKEINATTRNNQVKKLRILITIRAKPSQALFEASFLYNEDSNVFDNMTGDISRVNRYYKQSLCVTDPEIRKFCYCKSSKR